MEHMRLRHIGPWRGDRSESESRTAFAQRLPQATADDRRHHHFNISEVEDSVGARFDRVALRYRDQLAISDGVQALSCEALSRYANRIAHGVIRCHGDPVPVRRPVALLFARRMEMVAGLVGVMKAGRIAVPLARCSCATQSGLRSPSRIETLRDAEPGIGTLMGATAPLRLRVRNGGDWLGREDTAATPICLSLTSPASALRVPSAL